jgi:hypothetical protein
MDVHHRTTPHMDHGRQLMHPLAVVALVVGARLRADPAIEHQRAFDLAQGIARHQHVDVPEQAAHGHRMVSDHVGRALEQHDRDAQAFQRRLQAVHLPEHGLPLPGGKLPGAVQVARHGGRDGHARTVHPFGQRAQQVHRSRG